MESKACTKCGVVKPLSEFYFYKPRNYYWTMCNLCKKENNRRWQKENENSARQKRYRDNNREAIKKSKERWDSKNRDKIRERLKKNALKNRKQLTSPYIICLLTNQGFFPDQITPELIELKREQLEMTRLARQLKQAVRDNQECPI